MLRDDQNAQLYTDASIWTGYLRSPEQAPCPCCSGHFHELNQSMAVNNEQLTHQNYWHSKAPVLPEVSTRVCLLVNAKIYTVDEEFSTAEAIAIQHGKVLATGTAESLKAEYQEADIIDANGKVILPGFIEPHMHFLPIASMHLYENVGPFRFGTTEAAILHLKQIAHSTPKGEWIMARQFDPSLQDGPRVLTSELLNQVSTEHPVFVYNASLHFAYCNQLALDIAGINRDTPDEVGSSFGRDSEGNPNGVLQGGKCMSMVARNNPALKTYDLGQACVDVCHHANSVGFTTICDQATGMSRGVKEPEMYETMAASGAMTVRLRYSLSYGLQDRWDETDIAYGQGNEWVRAVGWKIVSDGSNQGFTGLQREPYLYSDEKGVAYVEANALKAMVIDRAEKGWPLVIHANGDQAIDNTLDAFEAADAAGLLDKPPYRIEHCSILHDEQIDRIAKLNISPSFLIGHVHYWGHAMRDLVFGEQKATLLDRTASCEAKGIRWTLHSDEPVTEMNPLRCIENAVCRDLWKEPGNTLASEEAINVQTAIRAMTRDAAWQCHSDHEIGSLEAGKFADFVMLDQDPMTVPSNEIGKIKVLETWVDGRQVYSAS